jgi:hypothetical protein
VYWLRWVPTPPTGGAQCNAEATTTGGVYRAFTNSSEWNTPLPPSSADEFVHDNSDAIIDEIEGFDPAVYWPKIVAGADFAEPFYWGQASDPNCQSGQMFTYVNTPANAAPSTGSDKHLTIIDIPGGTVVKYWHATDTGDCFTGETTPQYELASNGLHKLLPESDSTNNFGHRGYPPAIHGVRYDEVDDAVNGTGAGIRHVIKIALDGTADCHHYPGQDDEGAGKGGTLTCEGLIVRVKPGIDLTTRGLSSGCLAIARSLQRYGAVIGDTGGIPMAIKVENLAVEGRSESWSTFGVSTDCFKDKVSFADMEVVTADYHRP